MITCNALSKAIVKIHVLHLGKAEIMFLPHEVCCEQLYSIKHSKNRSNKNGDSFFFFLSLQRTVNRSVHFGSLSLLYLFVYFYSFFFFSFPY